ncbi:hypothetical protein JCM10369A_19400 [Nocardioides pyridinolyticus]
MAAAVAPRASADRPTAVAISSDGTAYVGFAGGDRIRRLAAGTGKPRGTLRLPDSSAVAGLFATSGGSVWVDQESGVSLLGRNGRVLTRFGHRPERSCGAAAPASRYGGITAHGDTVYVANRCHGSVSVYSRKGRLRATVDLPGRGYSRGIAYGVAQDGRPATLYVAMPDRGVVLAYRASSLRKSSRPMRAYTVKRPVGGRKPQPAGVAVDKRGQLTIADRANNALYLVDANNHFSLYRTLGHPPRASREAGRLNTPGAIAQHPHDGSGIAGDLFIADTNNTRVQRWDNGGYTYWAKQVNAAGDGPRGPSGPDHPDPPTAEGPVNQTLPSITGTAAVGRVLVCSEGTWIAPGGPAGGTVEFTYRWRRDGARIPGATAPTYAVVQDDDGTALDCVVRAENHFGYREATSLPITVGGGTGGGDRPTNTTRPAITGSPTVGATLACDRGVWTGTSPTFSYQWRRDTAPIADATSPSYTVVAADGGTTLTCTVTATTSAGGTSATSAAFAIGGATAGPANTSPPSISPAGPAAVGTPLTCSPGAWTGATQPYAYAWRRDGLAIVGATTATYTPTAADAGSRLVCLVIASNDVGNAAATSPDVTVVDANPPTNAGGAAAPTLSGSGAVGTALTCSKGTWTGTGIDHRYSWNRNGAPIADTRSDRYVVLSEDLGTSISCTVTARNAAGTRTATTAGMSLDGIVGGAPAPGAAPAITGTAAVGQTLTCDPGTWTNAPTGVTTLWQRDGETVGTGPTWVVVAPDTTATLRCLVIASNAAGAGAARSTGVGGGACQGATGVVINGGAADTISPHVQLSIRVPAGTTSISISNRSDMSGAQTVSPSGTCTYAWTMDSVPGLPLTWSVYVRLDGTGTIYSDAIRIDQPVSRFGLW